jgi:hypothetical protein
VHRHAASTGDVGPADALHAVGIAQAHGDEFEMRSSKCVIVPCVESDSGTGSWMR